MNKEVRKGLVNHEVNRDLFGFIALESVMLIVVITYFGITMLGWNWFATLIISSVVIFTLVVTPVYPVLGIFFSLGWGYIGYRVFYWITTLTGGGKGLVITIGVLGFIIFFVLTMGARYGGKRYLDDIGN